MMAFVKEGDFVCQTKKFFSGARYQNLTVKVAKSADRERHHNSAFNNPKEFPLLPWALRNRRGKNERFFTTTFLLKMMSNECRKI